MAIQVQSEILPLRRVLLHRPGLELEHLIPGSLERLLFDDIPYLSGAQLEHDRFAALLRENGAEVCYLADLVAETLEQSPAYKEAFISDFIEASGSAAQVFRRELYAYLMDMPSCRTLVLKTMAGVSAEELHSGRRSKLAALLNSEEHFVSDPIPNLYFTRDPFAAIGVGASVNRMYSVTRNRETLYGSYVLQFHPDYAGKVPFYYSPEEPFSLEGGDILNLSETTLAVGVSQRTRPEAIEQLAKHIFSDPDARINTVLALDIPSIRAFMHLDTVLTQVDEGTFVVHPGILDSLRVFELRPGSGDDLLVSELSGALPEILARFLPVDSVTLLQCGGKNRVSAEREQWNDGSNTLCIAPGVVVAYDRNYITNSILEDYGVRVLKTPSAELSRGRGGPRCMSMPLWRGEMAQNR